MNIYIFPFAQDEKFASEFSLLTQCANVFNKVELVLALEKLSQPKKVEAAWVKAAIKKMKEVATDVFGAGLKGLNAVNRHPVILLADKVQQLFLNPSYSVFRLRMVISSDFANFQNKFFSLSFILIVGYFLCAMGAIRHHSDAANLTNAVPGVDSCIAQDARVTEAAGLALHLLCG